MANILLIDDDPNGLACIKQVLQNSGYGVVTAVTGKDGMRQFRLQPADLVITDLLMPEVDGLGKIGYLSHLAPEMDGLELIERLSRQYPDVKILAMTGAKGAQDLLQTAELLGATRVLAKPIGASRLLQVVHEELEPQHVGSS